MLPAPISRPTAGEPNPPWLKFHGSDLSLAGSSPHSSTDHLKDFRTFGHTTSTLGSVSGILGRGDTSELNLLKTDTGTQPPSSKWGSAFRSARQALSQAWGTVTSPWSRRSTKSAAQNPQWGAEDEVIDLPNKLVLRPEMRATNDFGHSASCVSNTPCAPPQRSRCEKLLRWLSCSD